MGGKITRHSWASRAMRQLLNHEEREGELGKQLLGVRTDCEAGERPRPVAEKQFLTVECFQYRMISGMFSTGCSR